jgi:hypothetical protein
MRRERGQEDDKCTGLRLWKSAFFFLLNIQFLVLRKKTYFQSAQSGKIIRQLLLQ